MTDRANVRVLIDVDEYKKLVVNDKHYQELIAAHHKAHAGSHHRERHADEDVTDQEGQGIFTGLTPSPRRDPLQWRIVHPSISPSDEPRGRPYNEPPLAASVVVPKLRTYDYMPKVVGQLSKSQVKAFHEVKDKPSDWYYLGPVTTIFEDR